MIRHTHYTLRALYRLAADNGGGSGGSGKTIEQELADAVAENKKLVGQVDALTKERDEAKGNVSKLEGQFNSAAKEATDASAEVVKVTGERDLAVKERDETKTKLTAADANVTRLETLCKVKGVDKDATVPAVEQPGGATGTHVYDQYQAAKAAGNWPEVNRLRRSHKKELRAEGLRRSGSSDV